MLYLTYKWIVLFSSIVDKDILEKPPIHNILRPFMGAYFVSISLIATKILNLDILIFGPLLIICMYTLAYYSLKKIFLTKENWLHILERNKDTSIKTITKKGSLAILITLLEGGFLFWIYFQI